MRLCRFDDDRLGLVTGEEVRDVTPVVERLPARRWPFPQGDPLIAGLDELKPAIAAEAKRAPVRPLAEVKLLSPIANPSKIVAAPVNYRRHLEEARADAQIHFQKQVEEIQKIGLFLKATSALVGPSEGVALRHLDRRNDHEVELALVIGKPADRVRAADWARYVAGYAIGLDMTIRGPEERSLRKSVDSYCVVGPWLVTADEIADPTQLTLSIAVNGEPRQKANTRDLVLGLGTLVELASSFYTLLPGDIILTGTPEGVGPVRPGDVMEAAIDGIGAMRVAVRAA
ncbi:MAG TPA: fumarylacetoacetate hydrolase family protein [Stellaceae bacterium]|jgi:2,4-diketo-3-deoxy-L-fuconate hydrolase|nr:fumarylacetoacetate hydrolase family protein [Stellaceae bacterium]